MNQISPEAREKLEWLFSEWTEKIAAILESMAEERPRVDSPATDAGAPGTDEAAPGAILWEQSFSLADKPLIWISTPETAVQQLGEKTLRASGVETMDSVDTQNTYLEVLSQSLSALGQSISSELERSSAATNGGPVEQVPDDLHWLGATLEFSEARLETIWFGCSQQILGLMMAGVEAPKIAVEEELPARGAESRESRPLQDTPSPGQSKTFDLLLDVSLSVCISFGRTFLPIREVLKLTTGSIVELDRAVNEPVEIIVNNCVIARGEVVVVEGNYGVRINQIASRDDRLKTGSTAAEAQQALSAR